MISLAQINPMPPDLDQVLSPYMGVFFLSLLVGFIMTPVMRWMAIKNGIVDWPDLKRKAHIEPVAYLGGVAIFLAWICGVFLCFFAPGSRLLPVGLGHVQFPISILLGAGAITLTGLIDDVYGISPRVKVGGQLFAAAALASEDVGIQLVRSVLNLLHLGAPGWVILTLGAVAIAVFVVGGCNSVNLLDGLDGLAAGVLAISCLGFLFIAIQAAFQNPQSDWNAVRVVMCLAALGALLGYLPYNFNPATIFMGDAGSLLLGYLGVSTILLFAVEPNNGPLLVMASLIVFALPITDTSLAIVRRKMRGQPIFSPDNQHIHHQLLRAYQAMGFSQSSSVKLAVLTMYALGLLFTTLGCAMVFQRWRYVVAVFMVVFGFILVTAYKAGHRQLLLQQLSAQNNQPPKPAPPPAAARTSEHPST